MPQPQVPAPRVRARRPGAVLGALACAVLGFMLTGCGGSGSSADAPDAPASSNAASGGSSGGCHYVQEGQAARSVHLPPSNPAPADSVAIVTNRGDLGVTLRTKQAPCTVGSFTSLARQGYFDDTRCHRLVTAGIFVLQCGDPTGTGSGGPGYRFADELSGKETYPAGTLAMANAGPDTNGSQFFIVYQDSPLPAHYTVFGKVDPAGLAVVRKVAAAGSDDANGAGDGHPVEDVVIRSVG